MFYRRNIVAFHRQYPPKMTGELAGLPGGTDF
jgi:hypothetical protein